MIAWDSKSEKVTKISPDTEKSKALIKLVQIREDSIDKIKDVKFTTLIVETYYEIIKELITSIMSRDGYKTTSHEMLIAYLHEIYQEFTVAEIVLIDNLRKTRNNIAYRGATVQSDYLDRNRHELVEIIGKLKKIASEGL